MARAPSVETYRQNVRELLNVQKGSRAAERDPATINKKPRVVIRGPPAVTKKRDKKARGHCPAHPVRDRPVFSRGPWSVVQKKTSGARGHRVIESEQKSTVRAGPSRRRGSWGKGIKSMFLTNISQFETYLCDKSYKGTRGTPMGPLFVTKF